MSNYIKSTNFATKDGLITGNPLKIVTGTEINDEFNAIQVANNSKANSNSPALTGVPISTTASVGTSTTQIATTNFVTLAGDVIKTAYEAADTVLTDNLATAVTDITTAFQLLYPVGSVYMNASNAANPATLMGFGTWVAFGAGRVPVGLDSGDIDFDTGEETGGAKTVTLTEAQMPAHTHLSAINQGTGGAGTGSGQNQRSGKANTETTTSAGGDEAHNNLQPYIVVHMWKRTA